MKMTILQLATPAKMAISSLRTEKLSIWQLKTCGENFPHMASILPLLFGLLKAKSKNA